MDIIRASFIIPAHNEAFEIGRSLKSVFDSARAAGKPFEVIVVDDASTDRTSEIARQAGARVINVRIRKISAVRNAGSREAKGDALFFVDADTQISVEILRAAYSALEHGAAGGGSWVTFAEPVHIGVRAAMGLFAFFYMRLARWAPGCFIYARRDIFEAVGGFDESLFAGEEIILSMALKRRGRFVLLHDGVMTSGRKIRLYSPWLFFPLLGRFLIHGTAVFRQREGLGLWYEGKREK